MPYTEADGFSDQAEFACTRNHLYGKGDRFAGFEIDASIQGQLVLE